MTERVPEEVVTTLTVVRFRMPRPRRDTVGVVDAHAIVPADYITAIDHVGVAVADLDSAIAWYATHLGMVETCREVNESQGVQEAMLALPQAPDSATALQLLAPLSDESTIATFLARHGPGVQQVAYRVTDIDTVTAYLRGRGLRLLFETPGVGTGGARINFLHPKDAGGVLIELIEPVSEPTD